VVIKCLIDIGLYNAAFKVLDEASIIGEDGKTVYIKDQWRPLYLAVKYLYDREELYKQPSELREPAFSFMALITSMEEIFDDPEEEAAL
jgi:hypothetical protein